MIFVTVHKTYGRPISRSITQNHWKDQRVAYLRSIDASEIRVDQQQVNFAEERVGINRPDIQYSHGSRRYYEEVDRSNSNRGKDHANRILANDPDGIVYLWTVD